MAGGPLSVAIVTLAVVRTGCSIVTPEPPVGEPVPDIVLTYTQDDPISGFVTITATPQNFVPTRIEFKIDMNTVEIDTAPPFEVTLDSTGLIDGTHWVIAKGGDGAYDTMRAELFVTRNRPNFVFVFVDDLDETTTSYWDVLPQTKALIADAGMTFTNAFAPDPVCCPARASVLTGNYPHNSGVWSNGLPLGGYTVFKNGAEVDTVATRLQAEGYKTALIGKYLNGYESNLSDVPPGWDEWFGIGLRTFAGFYWTASDNGTQVGYGYDDEDYKTDVLTQRALDFLDSTEARDARRFFLHVTPTAPHNPIGPAPRHADNPWVDDPLPTRPNFDEADVSDKPTWIRDGLPPIDQVEFDRLTAEHQNRMGSLLAVDDMVAAIVGWLQANDEIDNTYLIFMSDNGYNLGAHRVPDKSAPYDESIRIPFAMAGPAIPPQIESAFVTQLDIAPTLLDLALADHSDLDGESLVPLFDGTPPWRNDFLLEYYGSYTSSPLDTLADVQQHIASGLLPMRVPTYRGLRTPDWLYVEWYGGSVHEYELYDMAADPFQLDNLVATPEGAAANSATTAALHARMEELAACAGPTCHG